MNVARVEKYLGLPTIDDDVFFTAGRRAENLFHYNAMRSLPGFEELTVRYCEYNFRMIPWTTVTCVVKNQIF